jgi:RNA-directed DNA polymerase
MPSFRDLLRRVIDFFTTPKKHAGTSAAFTTKDSPSSTGQQRGAVGERSETASEDAVVADKVKPLKPDHRRLALRDPRLKPRPKPKTPAWPRPPRRSVMPEDEAKRFFSDTMRSRNRGLRDLVTDPAQLKRFVLPPWETEEQVAEALGMSLKELRFYAIHRRAERYPHYVAFTMPKRNGGERLIMAPKRRLKELQRKLLALLVHRLPVSKYAHGFRRGSSIKTAAEPHVGKKIVLHLDLTDFFHSVTFARVRGLLIALGYGYVVATTLAVLMTEAPRQPVYVDGTLYHVPTAQRRCVQGAPTSPGLCNTMALRLDRRLAGIGRKLGFAYSRYVDDLVFSGDHPERINKLRFLATRIVREEGFEVNADKTRFARRGGCQRVTGVVVNSVLGLSRQERRRLRSLIHRLKHDQLAGRPDDGRLAYLRGKLAYLNMLNEDQAAKLRARLT